MWLLPVGHEAAQCIHFEQYFCENNAHIIGFYTSFITSYSFFLSIKEQIGPKNDIRAIVNTTFLHHLIILFPV